MRTFLILTLGLLLSVWSASSFADKIPPVEDPPCTTQPYDGPFVDGKYPVSHLVYLDRETGCFKRWRVSASSPYDVRCAYFNFPRIHPKSAPDDSKVLTPEQVDAYLEALGFTSPPAFPFSMVNTSVIDAKFQHFKLRGFRQDVTPDGKDAECP